MVYVQLAGFMKWFPSSQALTFTVSTRVGFTSFKVLWEPQLCIITCVITIYLPVLTSVGGDDSEKEEEADSNNDRESLQSERTDKDDDTYEGISHRALSARPGLTR